MDMQKMQDKATAKINQYGRSLSYTYTPSDIVYTDSITSDVVVDPIKDYNGILINPATMNTVIASEGEVTATVKALELESSLLFGDYASSAKFLGGLISEDTISFMVPAATPIDIGAMVVIDGLNKNVIEIQSIRPGDITIYKVLQVKR